MSERIGDSKVNTFGSFKAYCPLMIIYAVLTLALVVVSIAGIKLPFDAETFESTTASKITTTAAGVIGLIAGFLGLKAVSDKNITVIKVCGALGFVMIGLYCATMFLGQAHTNPHFWIFLGASSVIPGSFAGSAMRMSALGLDS